MVRQLLTTGIFMSMTLCMQAADYTFRLKNTLGFQRTHETVEVKIPETIDPNACQLTDQNGQTIPFETVSGNTIRFQATVGRGATTGYTLTDGTPTRPEKLTYAAIKMPTSRADIAWENDLCAYRMYSQTLLHSEANTGNGVDVWFKKRATPVIDDMYNLSNYHNESEYGVDAYSVNGRQLGNGGVAAVVNGQLQVHDPYNQCEIVEQSALRTVFVLTYNNVVIDGSSYTKTLRIETTAGSMLNKATMKLTGTAKTIRMAVALYQHTDMSGVTPEGVAFTEEPGVAGWAEQKSEGTVTSTGYRMFQGAYMPGEGVETQVIGNHLCLIKDYTPGEEMTFYFGAGWNIFPTDKYSSDDEWFESLVSFKQCVENPLTPTSVTTLPQRDDVLHILNTVNQTWQDKHPTHGDHFWNRAVYHVGNMAAYDATGDQQYLDYSTAWAEQNGYWGAKGTDKSKWKYSYGETADYVLFGDHQICFQIYADLYNLDPAKDEQKIARAREVMEYQMSTTQNDYWWWVDGLFMVMPVMTKLHAITGNEIYLSKMYEYWRYATDLMCDETGEDATGLYYRDAKYIYPTHKTNAGKKDFWARGDGWIFAAFAKVLSELPEDDAHRAEYISYYQRMAAAIKACQQPEGYWTRSMLDPDYAPGRETSGTALFAYGYAWGINNGLLSEQEYGETLEKAWNYLSTIALQEDGTVGYIQPIGEKADPNQTVSATSYHDFGVGAYLLAAAEMSRYAIGDLDLPKLRLSSVATPESDMIVVKFNHEPNEEEAIDASHYTLNDEPIQAVSLLNDNNIVYIQLKSPLDYGLYTFKAEGIHTLEGGEMAEGQTKTLLRTVPLTAPQSGVTVTAIGAQSGNPASNSQDNNLSTRWSQQGQGQWIQYNIGSVQTVEAVDIAFYNGQSRVAYFDIQTSVDGTNFSPALTDQRSSGMTTELERYPLNPVDAQYVRIVCNGTSASDWNSITEARIRVRDNSIDLIEMPDIAYTDIIMPTNTQDGNPIIWTSSNKEVLTNNGTAEPMEEDRTVTLTATVGSTRRSFDIVLKARSLAENLQLCYTFEEGDLFSNDNHRMVRDLSPKQRDGELMNTRAQVTLGELDLTQNKGTEFSSNGYMLVPEGLLDSLRSYTILFRAKPTNLNKQPRFYDFGSASGNSVFLRGNTLAAGVKYNSGTTVLATANKQITTGEEHLIAVTYSARTNTTTVWLDGDKVAETGNITREPYELNLIGNDTRNYIGRTQWWQGSESGNNLDYCGTMDDFHVFSLALTAEEIENVFNGVLTDISELRNDSVKEWKDSAVYDLSGRRVTTPGKGIYIIRGKKVIIK